MFSLMSVTRELRRRVRADQSPPAFEPCLPRLVDRPPAGSGWIHEIKHDGFRILVRRKGRSIRLISRNGYDLADRFPLIAAAIEQLPIRSCVIDGEAVACDDNGLAVFELIRHHGSNARAVLCAFDLLELNGKDLRRRRSKSASTPWPTRCTGTMRASPSTRTMMAMARPSTSTRARSAAKASCRRSWAPRTARGDHPIGSRPRTQLHRPCAGLKKKIGRRDRASLPIPKL